MAGAGVAFGGGGSLRLRWSVMPLVVALAAPAVARAAVPVRVECTSSAMVDGTLRSIDRDAVVISVDGEERVLPIADVRVVHRAAGGAAKDADAGRWVEVTGSEGLRLVGDDLAWAGPQASLVLGDERIELPVARIRRVVWRTGNGEPAWLAAIPETPMSDLLAVTRGDGFELVECAIQGVSAEFVTVTLDGERIPVKRGKVLGIVMPGQPRPAGDGPLVRIAIAGGRLGGASVVYRDETLVVDEMIRIPGPLVEAIDLAAGRTVALVDLPLESSTSEPTFVATNAVDGLADFFAPRIVRPDAAAPAWLMRPTSTATWRIPAATRRLHGHATAAGGGAASAVEIVVRPDVGAPWRRRLEPDASVRFDLEIDAARRLTIEIAPVAEGIGFPVRVDAAFEK